MVQKGVKKLKQKSTDSVGKVRFEKALVENFISLQQVMTNLAIKFDNLSNQISKLLELFEISAKVLAEKEPYASSGGEGASKKTLEKLDNLLEQNKVIARGLSLLHEKAPQQTYQFVPQRAPQYMNPSQQPTRPASRVVEEERYQKSSQNLSANPKFKKIKG